MTLKQLEELEALVAEATPGPWDDLATVAMAGQNARSCGPLVPLVQAAVDRDFIAASRTAVPELCQALREALATLTYVAIYGDVVPHDAASVYAATRDEARAFLERWEEK